MNESIVKVLEKKGIQVPAHHVEPLMAQWEGYQQLKNSLDFAKLADNDIGLRHIPGVE